MQNGIEHFHEKSAPQFHPNLQLFIFWLISGQVLRYDGVEWKCDNSYRSLLRGKFGH